MTDLGQSAPVRSQTTANRLTPRAAGAPRVSVVMPVYNGERFIAETIESVLAQTFSDWEFVIVNDGSTDSTPAIVQMYATIDRRIIAVRGQHAGIVNALNRGLETARGDLVARIDADDIALPRRLERQVDYLETHPECIAVGSSVLTIDAQGQPLSTSTVPDTHREIVSALLARRTAMWHPSVTYRRREIIRLGGYDQQYEWAEDFDLWLRLAHTGGLANLSEPLLRYRLHDTNVGVTYRCRQPAIARRSVDAYCRRNGYPMPQAWREGASDRLRRQVWICMEEDAYRLRALPWAIAAVCCNPFKAINYRVLLLSLRRLAIGR